MDTQQEYWKVAISGDLGSGKSTVCKILEEKLACKVYSTGKIQRKIAEKYNMTTLELNKYSETHPEIDQEIDAAVAALAKEPENIVFDSRLAWHFVPDSFKVHLIVDIAVAAKRVLTAKRGKSETYASLEEAIDKLRQRKTSENNRYCEIYQVNCSDWDNYNLIIDTSYAPPQRVARLLIDNLNEWLADKKSNKTWNAPKVLYPS
jgi:cytidylate kinase